MTEAERFSERVPDVLMVASTLAADGGLPATVARLAALVVRQGRKVRIVGPCPGPICEALATTGAETTVLPTATGVAGIVRAMAACRRAVRSTGTTEDGPRVLHIHGVWTAPVVAAAWEASREGIPYVISPHGMLLGPALHRHRIRKRLAIALVTRRMLERARLVHCTSVAEADAVRQVAPGARTVIIPFGVDAPSSPAAVASQRRKSAGYLGRLVAVKNLDTLLRAWAAERPAGWSLRIVGPDGDGTGRMLERMVDRLDLRSTVTIEGPIPKADVPRFLAEVAVVVQPSRSENFGLGIAEALAWGTPVITTTGTPWAGISEHGCGWYVPPTEAGLGEAIRQATACPGTVLADMGRKGAAWIAADFSWTAVEPRFVHELYGLPAAARAG